MALPQDISPVNVNLTDTMVKASKMPWMETSPGMAYQKILWLGPETRGRQFLATEA